MKRVSVSCAFILATLTFFVARGQAFPLWGNLKPGPYSVGYKTLLTYDLSRPAIPQIGSPEAPGRQMQISVWYPARLQERPSYLRFDEYVVLQSRELDFSILTQEKRQQSRQSFMEGPLARGANMARLDALLRTPTAAIKNARPATGRFPLIIFAHSSVANESILCEYLASHGFIVAAVPSKGSFEYDFDVGLSGLETLIKDMEFVLASAKKFPFVDGQRLALIGMSFGSAAVIGFQTRHSEVGAMISLDGGIGEGGVSFLLTRTPYYGVSRIKAPLLHLYTPNNPNLDLTRMEGYKYATRYLVSIPRMRHSDFVAHGMLEQIVPKMFGESPGDTKSGFEWVCRYARSFLEGYLKNDPQGIAFLQRSPEINGVPKGLLTMSTKPGLPSPPTTSELRTILESQGFEKLVSVYSERKALNPQPFSQTSFSAVIDLLTARKQLEGAKKLGQLFLDSYPDSVRAHFALANVALQLGDHKLASNHFGEVLRLVNDDPELDYRTRKRLEATAKQELSKLD
jgi:Platelet-activating factor acetylhydrolase, isoform II